MFRTALTAGLVGIGTGIAAERYRQSSTTGVDGQQAVSGHCNRFAATLATVFAAKPFDTTSVEVKSPSIGSGGDPISPSAMDIAKQQVDTEFASLAKSSSADGSGSRLAVIARHGFPSLDTIRTYDNFVLSYDRRNRTANWVLEYMSGHQMSADNDSGHIDRKGIEFFQDSTIHEYWRSSNDDYRRSGYDRGHLAAAGNHRHDRRLMSQTFVLSNISPQVGKGFNRDAWNRLEKYCRWRARRSDNTWLCTGPLYLPARGPTDSKLYVKYEVIGKNHVAVPTHFFKVLVTETNGHYDLEGYVLPNAVIDDRSSIESFRVPIDTIERAAGLLFFQRIPRQQFRTINGKSV
ncbi:endonuclease G, mitochondrial-like [Oppia nitens]|uniref:endonuclease G, mitochondrial-like n=1 Tax=Oppia nitens TaxID=1686743 RepID=UPI0023DBF2AD|nr:endonuclease G, mitochondrial-like [Oppia nitens]